MTRGKVVLKFWREIKEESESDLDSVTQVRNANTLAKDSDVHYSKTETEIKETRNSPLNQKEETVIFCHKE